MSTNQSQAKKMMATTDGGGEEEDCLIYGESQLRKAEAAATDAESKKTLSLCLFRPLSNALSFSLPNQRFYRRNWSIPSLRQLLPELPLRLLRLEGSQNLR
jgi:hypothetical protein